MNPFDMFSEIHCINLDRRPDRWAHAQAEFSKLGIAERVQRFSAVAHEDGRIGLIKSFLELFKYAKAKKLDNILIFEDDVTFINDPVENLTKAQEQLQRLKLPWDMFYWGANTHSKLTKLGPNLLLLKNAYAAHAVAYRHTTYDVIIDRFEKTNKINSQADINDVFFCELQNKKIAVVVNPIIATQYASYSDLEKRDVNYTFIEERFKQNSKA